MVTSVSSSSSLSTTSASSLTSAAASASSASTGAPVSAASLDDIEKQIEEQAAAMKKAQGQSAKQAALTVSNFQKTVRKSPYDTLGAATDIGQLQKDSTRLNAYGALDKKDKVDVLKFKNQRAGAVQVGAMLDTGLRMEVLTKYGSVIADSAAKSGKLADNYKQMQDGEYDLPEGDYYIRLTRTAPPTGKTKDGKAKTSQNYAIQLSMGVYSKDYDTIIKAPNTTTGASLLSKSQLALGDYLTSGSDTSSFMTGQSGTSKLSSTLFG